MSRTQKKATKGCVPWNKGLKGAQKHSRETRAKISETAKKRLRDPTKHPMFGKKHSAESRIKMSDAQSGEKNVFFGKSHSIENRDRISEAAKKRSAETRAKMSEAARGKNHSAETKEKMSEAHIGSKHWNWRGGTSFDPYCPKFNNTKKEEVRNRDGRRCQSCGKPEILNGRRLSVHHINSDKLQGCQGKKWSLVALCRSCHSRSDTVEKEFLIVSNLNLRWDV